MKDKILKKQKKYILESIRRIIFQFKELQEKCPEFIKIEKYKRYRITGIWLFTTDCPLQNYIHIFSIGLKTTLRKENQYDNNYIFMRRMFWNKLKKNLDAFFPETYKSLRELVEIIDEDIFKVYSPVKAEEAKKFFLKNKKVN